MYETFLNIESEKSYDLLYLCLQKICLTVQKSLFAETCLNQRNIFFLQKTFLFKKHLFDQLKLSCKNLSCFWKISMTVKSFRKVLLLWKSSWPVENFQNCGKFTATNLYRKIYFLDCRKNNRSNNFESKC